MFIRIHAMMFLEKYLHVGISKLYIKRREENERNSKGKERRQTSERWKPL